MINLRSSLVALGWAIIAVHSSAQTAHTPQPGSAERRTIMNLLRPVSERELGQKVIFRVQHLRVIGEWALARVVPLRPDGSEIDYSKTKYREANEEGAFDGEAEALLRRTDGGWKLLEWRFGATDTEVTIWFEKYRAPSALAD